MVCAYREGDAADEYALLPADRRGAWLVGHGCPASVAGYDEPAPTTGGTAGASTVEDETGGPDAAVRAAASEHGCPIADIIVQSEHVGLGHRAFWLYVCGEQRFYRWDATAHTFVDRTPVPVPSGGAATTEAPTADVAAFPVEVFGLRFGSTLEESGAACRTSGHAWEVSDLGGMCDAPVSSIGHVGVVMVGTCADGTVCSAVFRLAASDDVAVLRAFRDLRGALRERYGDERLLPTGSRECIDAFVREERTACIALGQAELTLAWTPGGGGIFMSVGHESDSTTLTFSLRYRSPTFVAEHETDERSL